VSDSDPDSDLWSDWLLHVRHGGDPAADRAVRAETRRFADRVLDGARLVPGMVLADIGAGDGLVAFRAIDRVGPGLRVILTDISAPLLRHAEKIAVERGVAARCRFVEAPAERLDGIADASVDALAMRAVLAYVADKPAAMKEFHRVLKPGGRLSIAEPIFRDEALAARALKAVIDARPPGFREPFMPLLHRWKAAQFPDTAEKIAASPIANFSERDLVRFAQGAGFTGIHMEFHIDTAEATAPSWQAFLASSPHPWAPPLTQILENHFSPEEREFFEPMLRSMVEAAQFKGVARIAYLTAGKPQTGSAA
jgi:arsenite methyltransferase